MQLPLEAALDLPVDDDGGVGPLPVVFVHALAGSAAQWSGQLENLRGQRRALALTLRGHAGAPVPRDGCYSIDALAADVVHTLDRLGIGRFALAGHSVGAHVALAVAAALPDRVASLLLVDPAGDARQAPRPDALLAALDSPGYAAAIEQHYRALLVGARPPATQRVLADLHATPADAVRGILRAMLAFDPLAALAAYPGPRLSVHTRFGEQPFSLHRLCPDLRSVRVGDSGHWLQLDRPKEFNLIVDGWLGAINSGRRDLAATAAR